MSEENSFKGETMNLATLIEGLVRAYNKMGDMPVIMSVGTTASEATSIEQVSVGFLNGYTGQMFCLISSVRVAACKGCSLCKNGLPH